MGHLLRLRAHRRGAADGHPLWGLFKIALPRCVMAMKLTGFGKLTIDTCKRLGLEADEAIPWYTPTSKGPKTAKDRWMAAGKAVMATNRFTSIMSTIKRTSAKTPVLAASKP